MLPGTPGTMTHDYKRHGTTSLFAALERRQRQGDRRAAPRHRAIEFLKFLHTIDREVPAA